MNQEETIRMANEAGMQLAWIATVPGSKKMKVLCDFDQVQRLVEIAADAENEACANAADEHMQKCEGKSFGVGAAIRARRQA